MPARPRQQLRKAPQQRPSCRRNLRALPPLPSPPTRVALPRQEERALRVAGEFLVKGLEGRQVVGGGGRIVGGGGGASGEARPHGAVQEEHAGNRGPAAGGRAGRQAVASGQHNEWMQAAAGVQLQCMLAESSLAAPSPPSPQCQFSPALVAAQGKVVLSHVSRALQVVGFEGKRARAAERADAKGGAAGPAATVGTGRGRGGAG